MPTVVVAGVYPPSWVHTLTGQVVCGDGSVLGGVPGVRFGAPRTITQARPAGLGSAQAFSTVTIVAGGTTSPNAGLGSAQAFGTLRFALRKPVSGVTSAQAFGTIRTALRKPVTGLSSAQAFGTITVRTGARVSVPSLSSAQAFGAVKPSYGVSVPGVPSAQAFGLGRFALTVKPPSLGSAQAFGEVKARIAWIEPDECFDLVLDPEECLAGVGGSITNQVICGDGHLVGGWIYLSPTGDHSRTLSPAEQPVLFAPALVPAETRTIELEPAGSK